jgi:hypothetical protein
LTHPELIGAVVQQQDGKDAVVDDGAHKVGHPVHERVQIERGIEGVGQTHQEVDLQGLGAGHGCRSDRGGGRAIVSLEGDKILLWMQPGAWLRRDA